MLCKLKKAHRIWQAMKSLLEKSAVARIGLAAVFVMLLTLTLRQINTGPLTAPDFESGKAGPEVIIEILPGETGDQIGQKLESMNVVKSALAFFRAAVNDERSARIAPGEHRLETQIPAKLALEQLLDPDRIPNLIRVRDGARLVEIKDQLINFGLRAQEVSNAITAAKLPAPFTNNSIEGFLYPAHYSFNKDVEADEIILKMIEKFVWMTREVDWNKTSKFTPYQQMIIASLVESEGTPDVFGKVSRVIKNRLKIGMPLQFDSTIHYALQRRGEIRISISETKVKSAYNTFLNRGLPPTPIGSPTLPAIVAAQNPEKGDWLYFVTVKPKETRFTSSYEEFLDWKAEYKRNLKAGLFK